MHVVDAVADVLEYGIVFSRDGCPLVGRLRLLDEADGICSDSFNKALSPAPPLDLNKQPVRHTPRRKSAQSLIASQVPATRDHFLSLQRQTRTGNPEAGANTLCI